MPKFWNFSVLKKTVLVIFFMFTVLLTSCVYRQSDGRKTETGNNTAAGDETPVRTILLWASGAYMDSSFDGPVARRLNKMMEEEIPDSVNIIVLTGGTDEGWQEDLSLEGADSVRTDCNQVWKMKGAHDGQKGALVLLEENGIPGAEKTPMSDPEMLRAFIDYGAENYPADKYDLILISHGGGPASGWGMDEVFQREDGKKIMSNSEICGALKDSAVEHFDLLCFYACLMGSVEDAVMFSPYADTLILSEENLPTVGIEFSGMMELLRKDPQTDPFVLGRQIADDTIDSFNGSHLEKTRNATLSVIHTKNLTERLVPEMAQLAEILYEEAAQAKENGEYTFYDEFLSLQRCVEFGTSNSPGYQLFDLGNFVTALGIAESEFESTSDVKNLTNAYTDVSVRIMNILNDRDGSGDDVLYCRDTDSMHKGVGAVYSRDSEGNLISDDSGFMKTTGLSIFLDMENTWYPVTYSETIDEASDLGDLDDDAVRFLKKYRDSVLLYALIQGTGKAVYELQNEKSDAVTLTDIQAAWEKLGIAKWEDTYSTGLIPNLGLTDICELVKASGFDVKSWLEKIAAQQSAEMMRAEQISIRQKESADEQDTAGSYRLVSDSLSGRQLRGLYMRVLLNADYPYNAMKIYDYSDQYVPFGDKYLYGNISTDLLMPALFTGETGGGFYRLVYGSQTALEIGLYDGQWYALKDADGKQYLVQVYRDLNNPHRVQVPAQFNFDEKYGEGGRPAASEGLLEFHFEDAEEAPAAGFVPQRGVMQFAEGCQPLDQEIFSGSTLQTKGYLRAGALGVGLSPEITTDDSETRGLSLVRIPVKECDNVKDFRAEYYLQDIYGNELVLGDKVTEAEKQPLLKNLAHAQAAADQGNVTVTYGDTILEADRDYMVYTRDDEILIQGIGEYAGSIILGGEEYKTGYVPVYRTSMEESETVAVRWYQNTPSVPYMGIREYYEMLFGEQLDLKTEGGQATLTASDGSAAVCDTEKGTLTSENLTKFIYPPKLKAEGHGNLAGGLPPFLAVKEESKEQEALAVTLDFAKYGIDVYADEDDLWLPLATLSDLFETQKNYMAFWNGRNIYIVDLLRTYQNGNAKRQDEHLYDVLKSTQERPSDLIDLTYRELCFNLETFYGYPSSTDFSKAVKAEGLDAALAEQDPETRALLLSADRAEYAAGLHRLYDYLLDDGGHTSFSDYYIAAYLEDDFAHSLQALQEQYDPGEGKRTESSAKAAKGVRAARAEKIGDASYVEQGDTAMFVFDEFVLDLDGWNEFYQNGAELPVETDTYAAFHAALDKAAANPEIRNFVIDLAANGGGESFSMSAMTGLICGESAVRFEDTVTGEKTCVSYLTDTNLDGAFDEQDLSAGYDFTFAVLTSEDTFSIANAMASILSDQGILILGEQSGGGSCSVQYCGTADGWLYTISNNIHLVNQEGEDLDSGVPVEEKLVTESEDGSRDYSEFYDLDRIRDCMNESR